MPKMKQGSVKIDTPARRLSGLYPNDPKRTKGQKVWAVVKWGLFVAAVSAAIAGIMILTGGTAVPVGATLKSIIGKEFLTGLIEGLLVGTANEVLGQKKANTAVNEVYSYAEAKIEEIREITAEEIEQQKPKIEQKVG